MITSELIVIFEKLKTLPAEKLSKQKEILALQIRKENLSGDIKRIANNTLSKVINEVDESGKAVYSNDSKRQIETDRRLGQDNNYLVLKSTLEDTEKKMAELSAEHEEIKDTIRVYEIISRIIGA